MVFEHSSGLSESPGHAMSVQTQSTKSAGINRDQLSYEDTSCTRISYQIRQLASPSMPNVDVYELAVEQLYRTTS